MWITRIAPPRCPTRWSYNPVGDAAADALIRDAVSHRLEVAIDAVGKVSPSLLEAEAPTDWPKIVGMRNMLAHQYADLDQEVLQNTIDNRLGAFVGLVERLRKAANLAEDSV
jgi:uncharacterized protein with HEPN domain